MGLRRVALHRPGGAQEADVEDPANRALQNLVAEALGLQHALTRAWLRRQQRWVGRDLVQATHDRSRADHPVAVEAQAGNGDASVEDRPRQKLSQRQHVDTLVGDALQAQRDLDGGARMRRRHRVERCRHAALPRREPDPGPIGRA